MKNPINSNLKTSDVINSVCERISKSTITLSLVLAFMFPLTSLAEDSINQSADSDKLDIKAGRSTDLYVEPDFNFQTFYSVMLNIMVTDTQARPVNEALISISAIPYEVTDLSDERLIEKSLLSYVRTDGFGRVYQAIEISNSVKKVLIELNIHGPDNILIVDLTDTEQVNHVFTSE